MERLVSSFEPDAWRHTGRGSITPARLSLHILQSAKGYMQDSSPVQFISGKPFDCDWITLPEEALPSQADILNSIEALKQNTIHWLEQMDLYGQNEVFPWAGETKFGLSLFLLRHSLFHIGEISSLLNESCNGDAEDIYVKAL